MPQAGICCQISQKHTVYLGTMFCVRLSSSSLLYVLSRLKRCSTPLCHKVVLLHSFFVIEINTAVLVCPSRFGTCRRRRITEIWLIEWLLYSWQHHRATPSVNTLTTQEWQEGTASHTSVSAQDLQAFADTESDLDEPNPIKCLNYDQMH